MTWQRRLRDLLLAGGTLTVLACSSGGSGKRGSDAGGGSGGNAGNAGSGGNAGNGGTGGGINFCCNAAYDPCCTYKYCDASLSTACACELDGGSWDYNQTKCKPGDAGSAGAGGATAEAGDAATDAGGAAADPGDAATDH